MTRTRASAHHEETEVDSGLHYVAGDPVLVRVVRREQRVDVTDGGAAAARTGLAPGWKDIASRLARDLDVNISRHGVVSLPVVAIGPGVDAIAHRIADASLAFYQELLELEA
jgi:hypothetical protein